MAPVEHPAPDFRALLETPISWSAPGDLAAPWSADFAGWSLAVRMNDFPDAPLYTLFIDFRAVISFDDWPARWTRN